MTLSYQVPQLPQPVQPMSQPPQPPRKNKHPIRTAIIGLGLFIVVIIILASITTRGSGDGRSTDAASAQPCTASNSCIAREAEKSVVGMTTKGESVVTKGVCKSSMVKRDSGGNYTVYCDLTFSDGSTAMGWVNLLPSQNKVTFEPDGGQ